MVASAFASDSDSGPTTRLVGGASAGDAVVGGAGGGACSRQAADAATMAAAATNKQKRCALLGMGWSLARKQLPPGLHLLALLRRRLQGNCRPQPINWPSRLAPVAHGRGG